MVEWACGTENQETGDAGEGEGTCWGEELENE